MKKEKKVKVKKHKKARNKLTFRDFLRAMCFIIPGTVLYSMGVAWFLSSMGLPNGGVSGLSITLGELMRHMGTGDIFESVGGTGTFIFILNIPLLILSLVKLGTRFSILTMISVGLSSAETVFFERFYEKVTFIHGLDNISSVIIAGILIGTSVGLVFRARSCLGGSDIVIKVLRQKYKYLKTGTLYLIIDGVVIVLGGIVFNDLNKLVYAIIALFIQSKMTDLVLYGQDGGKMIYIITDKEPVIAARLNKEVHSGVTYMNARGAYTGAEKTVIMCTVRKQSLPKAKEIVLQEDPKAFMIVTPATQVWGKGYKELSENEEV